MDLIHLKRPESQNLGCLCYSSSWYSLAVAASYSSLPRVATSGPFWAEKRKCSCPRCSEKLVLEDSRWNSNVNNPFDIYHAISQNHRMFGVGRDLCGPSSPTLLPKQGHLQQAAEDLVQAGLEYLQRRRLHNLPGQPVPVLCHAQREEVLPHVQMEKCSSARKVCVHVHIVHTVQWGWD